jgi:two-component system, LytTR family, response regulator
MKASLSVKLRTLIVDDMPLSRARVRRYLSDEPDVEVVGECGDADTAMADIDRLKPDLLMLDVQMPGASGFELLGRLPPDRRPAVVFITAFEEFAVQAFAAEAVDYLLKPFDHERLRQALAKVRARLQQRRAGDAAARGPHLDRIPIKSVGRTDYVSTSAIDWVESAGNYLSLHCGKDVHLVRETMSQFEAHLDPKVFLRIHRSTIVRTDAVQSVEPLFNGDRSVTLRDGTRLTLSRSYRERARTVLGDI